MRRYRVLLPLTVHTEDGAYVQGETFEKEFSEAEERENVQSGLLEIVPQTYKVVGSNVVHETEPGETFERALFLGEEALLIQSGQVELVEAPKAKPKRAPKADRA